MRPLNVATCKMDYLGLFQLILDLSNEPRVKVMANLTKDEQEGNE